MSAGQGKAIAERWRRKFSDLRRRTSPYQALAESASNGQVTLLETAEGEEPYEQPASKLRSADVRAGDLVLVLPVIDDQGAESFYVAGVIDDGTTRIPIGTSYRDGRAQTAADTPSTTSTTTFANAISWSWTDLPDGTYDIAVEYSYLAAHDTGGSIVFRSMCGGTAGTTRTLGASTGTVGTMRVEDISTFSGVVVAGGITIVGQHHASTSGTSYARNPVIKATATRTGD